MVSIISKHPLSMRIRASWRHVQKALFDKDKAKSSRGRHLDMSGEANLLFTGAKAVHSGNGIWIIYGYSSNCSDVTQALEKMRESLVGAMPLDLTLSS